jgi:hypothetical protein
VLFKREKVSMKRFAWILAVWVFGLSGWSQAEPIQVGDSAATFEAPPGFGPVPQALIDLKWPNKRAPRFVVGNERATTTVAYDLKPHKIPDAQLPEVKGVFTGMMERAVPGIRWINNDVIELAGQRWIFMEMTSTAVDTDIHNIMLITGVKDQMLVFNFNSTKQEFPAVEAALRASMRSIRMAR